jgi:hypothetical protein
LEVQGELRGSAARSRRKQVGWIRADISLRDPGFVSYEAALPPTVDEKLAAGAAEALSNEVRYVENHVRGTWRAPEWR